MDTVFDGGATTISLQLSNSSSKLLLTYPSSLPVSSLKLQGSKRHTFSDSPGSTISPIHNRKHSLTFHDTQTIARSSSIPLRIGSTSAKPATVPSKTEQQIVGKEVPHSRITPSKKVHASSVMNPTAASSMRVNIQKKPSSTFPSPVSKRSPLKPPVSASAGSPKRRNSFLHQQKAATSPISPIVASHPKPRPLPSIAHARQSLPATKPSSASYPDFPDFVTKRHSMARSSVQIGDLVQRNSNTSIESPTAGPKIRSARYSTSHLSPLRIKEQEVIEEVPPVPPLPEEVHGKQTLHATFTEKQKLKSRLSMQIPPITNRAVGTDLYLSEPFKDSKYPDFPSGKAFNSPTTSMPPPPKPSARKALSPAVGRKSYQLPVAPKTEFKSPLTSSEKRRSSAITAYKTPISSKSTHSLTTMRRKSSVNDHYESVTPTKHITEEKTNGNITKSHTMNDLAMQSSSSTTSLVRSNSKQINFESPGKSPYRPLNRPAHVYPRINKKPGASEEESTDRRNSMKVRSKSTVAKQWTTLSSNINSSSAKRLLLSPFSSEQRQKTPVKLEGRRAVSHSRNESPLEHKELLTEDEKQIQSIMKGLVHTVPEEDNGSRRYEDARIAGTLVKEAITPSLAAKTHRLNIYEQGEILDYRNVYFTGRADAKKISGDIRHATNNFGFDESNGDYKVIPGDHIAYRYEIVNVLGQGSFGKVLKCIDHKSGKLVAVKMIINRKRFHMQALIEADILRALSQWVSFSFWFQKQRNILMK